MLIRFCVENFASFKDQQIFSMAAGKQTRMKSHIYNFNKHKILKGSAIFGANASGKSNLIKAIEFGRNLIVTGVSSSLTYNKFFRIDDNSISNPGIFQYDFLSNGHVYSYGIVISYKDNEVLSEWLYRIDNSKEIKIFERENKNITTDIKFTEKDAASRFEIYSQDVALNKSFLFEIASKDLSKYNDFSEYYEAFSWFTRLVFIYPNSIATIDPFRKDDYLSTISNLMKYFDTGIESVGGQDEDLESFLSSLPSQIRDTIIAQIRNQFDTNHALGTQKSFCMDLAGKKYKFSKEDDRITVKQLMSNHGNSNALFDLSEESDGTKRLFDLIPIFKLAQNECVILVDELDRSFHTKLTIDFINKFFEKTSKIPSQLIVTLHDINVMNLDLLRQDEIWFTQREINHSSSLFSLNKFKERFDKDVAKEYLLGRYGAIPNIGIEPWIESERN